MKWSEVRKIGENPGIIIICLGPVHSKYFYVAFLRIFNVRIYKYVLVCNDTYYRNIRKQGYFFII